MCADHGLVFHPAQFEQATSALHSTRIWDALHAAIAETDMRMADSPLYEDRPHTREQSRTSAVFRNSNPQQNTASAQSELKLLLLSLIKFLNAQSDQNCHRPDKFRRGVAR